MEVAQCQGKSVTDPQTLKLRSVQLILPPRRCGLGDGEREREGDGKEGGREGGRNERRKERKKAQSIFGMRIASILQMGELRPTEGQSNSPMILSQV